MPMYYIQPTYFAMIEIETSKFKQICAYIIQLKLIIMLRDPIVRAFSQWRYDNN